jgi:hypothetical protein
LQVVRRLISYKEVVVLDRVHFPRTDRGLGQVLRNVLVLKQA